MSRTRQFAMSEHCHLHFVFVKKKTHHIFVSALLALYVIAFLFFNVNNCAPDSLNLLFFSSCFDNYYCTLYSIELNMSGHFNLKSLLLFEVT